MHYLIILKEQAVATTLVFDRRTEISSLNPILVVHNDFMDAVGAMNGSAACTSTLSETKETCMPIKTSRCVRMPTTILGFENTSEKHSIRVVVNNYLNY